MIVAPKPTNEAERLAALQAYGVLDREADPAYQDIVTLAGHITGAPITLISLVDAERQWFLAREGMAAPETHRDHAFCAHTILGADPLVVRDAHRDARFADNPLVTGDPRIAFYAGAPLETPEGARIGALCVIDRVPRELSPAQLDSLQALSRQVVRLLEFQRVGRRLKEALERTRTLGELLPICSGCRKIRDDDRYWQSLEAFLAKEVGTMVTHSICPDCSARLYPDV